MVAKGEGAKGGMAREAGVSGCKLEYIGRVNSKVLLHSAGNHIQYPVINRNGGEYEKEWVCVCGGVYVCVCVGVWVWVCGCVGVCVTESLCCTANKLK